MNSISKDDYQHKSSEDDNKIKSYINTSDINSQKFKNNFKIIKNK